MTSPLSIKPSNGSLDLHGFYVNLQFPFLVPLTHDILTLSAFFLSSNTVPSSLVVFLSFFQNNQTPIFTELPRSYYANLNLDATPLGRPL